MPADTADNLRQIIERLDGRKACGSGYAAVPSETKLELGQRSTKYGPKLHQEVVTSDYWTLKTEQAHEEVEVVGNFKMRFRLGRGRT